MIDTGKLHINLHVCRNDPWDEKIGHKTHFEFARGVDGISATANMSGFTVLNSIKMHFGWDHDTIVRASDECNRRDEVAVLSQLTPTLFLVPKTRFDDKEKSAFYIRDLLNAVSHVGIKRLQFTHYAFSSALMFDEEIHEVMTNLVDPALETSLNEIVFDADHRASRVCTRLFQSVQMELHKSFPTLLE